MYSFGICFNLHAGSITVFALCFGHLGVLDAMLHMKKFVQLTKHSFLTAIIKDTVDVPQIYNKDRSNCSVGQKIRLINKCKIIYHVKSLTLGLKNKTNKKKKGQYY